MKSTEYKLQVLSQIGEQLNQANITWAVGASLLLYLKGITTEFNDIDLMVTEADVHRLKEILLGLGTAYPSKPSSTYKTRYFFEFSVNDVEIDVMAGYIIVSNDKEYDCSLIKSQIVETIKVNGVEIPLQSVSLWRDYYRLMNRSRKVAMIDDALKQQAPCE